MILAEAGAEWLYILAVVVIVGISWVAERIKALMSDADRRDPSAPPRPARRHPTSLPRPEIPPLVESDDRPRPAVPPASPRPRPPVRPPVPQQQTVRPPEVRRAGTPARPAARPAAPRTIEERREIIRGESRMPQAAGAWQPGDRAPVAKRPAPVVAPAPVAAPGPVAAPKQETWSRLAKFGDEVAIRPPAQSASDPVQRREAPKTAPVPKARVRAASLRNLSVADLQRALVLKEILEPPLALRDE